MILLKKITLENFLSHENTIINFNDNEKMLIDGASGAGKSSIFEAIIWNLYGEGRANNASLVKKGAKKGIVTLELKRDSDTVIITRTATEGGKHTLGISTQDATGKSEAIPLSGVRELQNWIDKELIGASYLLFVNSVAYVQGNLESFVSQTAPKRKELLLEIIQAENYKIHYENARKTLSKLENDTNTWKGQLIELNGRGEAIKSQIGDVETYKTSIITSKKTIDDLKPKAKELDEKKSSINSILKTVAVIQKAADTALSDKTSYAAELASKHQKIAGKDELIKKLESKPILDSELVILEAQRNTLVSKLNDASKLQEERHRLNQEKPVIYPRNGEIERIEKQIEVLESKPVCPSAELCPYSGDHEPEKMRLREEIELIKSKIVSENIQLLEWEKKVEELPPIIDITLITKDLQSIDSSLQSVRSEINNLVSVQKDIEIINSIESEIPILQAKIEEKEEIIRGIEKQRGSSDAIDTASLMLELNKIHEDIDSVEKDIALANSIISSSTNEIANIEKNEIELKTIQGRIEDIQKEISVSEEKRRKVSLIKDAFGSKGIETLVIDNLLPKLEDKINDVLSKLSDFRVRLDTQKMNSDGTTMIEGLFITVLNQMNEELPFENYSGGEKLKISVAISEALATMQKVGFRLMDESFMGLDENSTESFAEVLSGLQNNFNQIFCISHLLQVKELFDKQLKIVKNNNTSYVK